MFLSIVVSISIIVLLIMIYLDRYKLIEKYICNKKGHDWETYEVYLEPHNHWHDIEQAGYCKRCQYDTHGQYENK